MSNYHVGCGITEIYAGTLNKSGNMWVNKSIVTDEAYRAVAQYCIEHNEGMEFNYKGKRYRLGVEEIKSEVEKTNG
jgi:hypothetical protein